MHLERVLCFKHLRQVPGDNTVKYQLRTLQLLPTQERPSYAGVKVEVLERSDGQLMVQHEGKVIAHQEAPPESGALRAAQGAQASTPELAQVVKNLSQHGLIRLQLQRLADLGAPVDQPVDDDNGPTSHTLPPRQATPRKEVRSFETTVAHLLALGDCMAEEGATHVAMESTGVYWKPVYNLLEERFTLLLANAHHIKAVPVRKTDVRDCEWIADLLRHELLRSSFVPPRPQWELREPTRYRTSLIRERAAEVNRPQQSLEGANIKLASGVTDILGKSGREMLEALIAGPTDAAAMAQLARKRMRQKLPEPEKRFRGRSVRTSGSSLPSSSNTSTSSTRLSIR